MSQPFRSEHKFLVHHSTRTHLLELCARYLIADPLATHNGCSPVLSLYYDTPTLDFYDDKLAGFGQRHKVRLRTYGLSFRPGQLTFLEIKQRLNDGIRKIRWRITDFTMQHLEPSYWVEHSPPAAAIFNMLSARHHLRPSVQVWYQREAYASVREPDVRITFDSNLIAMFPGERLDRDVTHEPLRAILPDNMLILEFKANDRLPGWLTSTAATLELQERPIPKYVLAVDSLRLLQSRPTGVYT
ncbi:polyphosphate polymerase domain-containing protein [Petrachloros mirabilis]